MPLAAVYAPLTPPRRLSATSTWVRSFTRGAAGISKARYGLEAGRQYVGQVGSGRVLSTPERALAGPLGGRGRRDHAVMQSWPSALIWPDIAEKPHFPGPTPPSAIERRGRAVSGRGNRGRTAHRWRAQERAGAGGLSRDRKEANPKLLRELQFRRRRRRGFDAGKGDRRIARHAATAGDTRR